MNPVLQVEHVTKTYASQPPVTALRDVNFTVNRGEVVCVCRRSAFMKRAKARA